MLQIINDTADLCVQLAATRDAAGRSELGRRMAIAVTDAEKLLAWLRETHIGSHHAKLRDALPDGWTTTGAGYNAEGGYERAGISGIDEHGRAWAFRFTSAPLAHRYRVAVTTGDDNGREVQEVGFGTSPEEAVADLLADMTGAEGAGLLDMHPCPSAD